MARQRRRMFIESSSGAPLVGAFVRAVGAGKVEMTLVAVPPALRAGIFRKPLGGKDVRLVGQIGVVRAEGVRAHRHFVIRHTHRDPAARPA